MNTSVVKQVASSVNLDKNKGIDFNPWITKRTMKIKPILSYSIALKHYQKPKKMVFVHILLCPCSALNIFLMSNQTVGINMKLK